MRFVVDRHLGRLAKWLRTLGYDAFYEGNCSDETMQREITKEGTVFLTTVREGASGFNAPHFLIVPKETIKEQLLAVVKKLEIDPSARWFSRCVICNEEVVEIAKQDCRGSVPEKVYELFESFTRCPKCERIYWLGTHTERLRKNLSFLLNEKM